MFVGSRKQNSRCMLDRSKLAELLRLMIKADRVIKGEEMLKALFLASFVGAA